MSAYIIHSLAGHRYQSSVQPVREEPRGFNLLQPGKQSRSLQLPTIVSDSCELICRSCWNCLGSFTLWAVKPEMKRFTVLTPWPNHQSCLLLLWPWGRNTEEKCGGGAGERCLLKQVKDKPTTLMCCCFFKKEKHIHIVLYFTNHFTL